MNDAPASLNVVHAPDGDVETLVASLRLRNDNVLVSVERPPQRHGLLHLPDTGPRPIDGVWARVLATGPGYTQQCPRCRVYRAGVAMTVTRGDRVLVESAKSGDRWHIGGREYRVVRESEIMAVAGG